jgi:dTDP-4-amino-4,6-dideoxygalactose transaminase
MAAIYNNAVPIFADVRRDTLLIDVESVRERISERTKAIICTHFGGLPCDMDPLMEIAEEHGLAVIEDNAHGIFAEYKGRLAGTLGHMGEFSFQMGKQLGLGDGGMATTMDERFIEGLVDASGIRGLSTFPKMMWNYRMNEVIAAIGIVQLKRARKYVQSGIANAGLYDEVVKDAEWIRPQHVPVDRTHSHHLWVGVFEGEKYGISRTRFEEAVSQHGLMANVGYLQIAPYLFDTYTVPLTYGRGCPMSCPLQLKRVEYKKGLCPVAEEVMPKLVIIRTLGTREEHLENAEKLGAVVEKFS